MSPRPDPARTVGSVRHVEGLGTVLWCPAEAGVPVHVAVSALHELMGADAAAGAVAFADRPEDLDSLGAAAAALGGEVGGIASTAPVVDALKRVDGDVVVETVDRSALVRVVAPAIVRADVLRAALVGTDPIEDVRPLALVGRTHRILPLP